SSGSISGSQPKMWPALVHRRIYYSLINALERRVYPNSDVFLVAVSRKTAGDLERYYQRTKNVEIAYHGLDLQRFEPARRWSSRDSARSSLRLNSNDFVVLLIGNDWKNKGLGTLLSAVGQLRRPAIQVLVVGSANPRDFDKAIHENELEGRVHFLP